MVPGALTLYPSNYYDHLASAGHKTRMAGAQRSEHTSHTGQQLASRAPGRVQLPPQRPSRAQCLHCTLLVRLM